MKRLSIATLASILLSLPFASLAMAQAQSLDSLAMPPGLELRAAPVPPSRLAERAGLVTGNRLVPAAVGAVDELEALRSWNREGRLPRRNGFERALPVPMSVRLDAAPEAAATLDYAGGVLERRAGGELVWTTSVVVEGAHRLRLRLDRVELPASTRMWVYADDGETVGPFGLELRDGENRLWTPSVAGPRLVLEIELPRTAGATGRSGFELEKLLQLFPLNEEAGFATRGISTSCLIDASCVTASQFPGVAAARAALGHLQFGGGFLCSGNLLNNTNEDFTPYLLTANHCISTQPDAASLEVFWDYKTSSCNGSIPSLSSLPRSNGSTLLATGASSDFTLLRLTSVPGSRIFLGWTTATLANNTNVYRLSHPVPEDDIFAQTYTRYRVDTAEEECPGTPRPNFIHSKNLDGGTFGGSSGSSLMNSQGQVVGQLTGACGPDPDDGCNFSNTEVDGAFASSFPALQSFLSPPMAGPCTGDATTLCISDAPGDNRFEISLHYFTSLFGGIEGDGGVKALTSLGITKGGIISFTDPSNPELLVKVLNFCGFNGFYWVFFAPTTTLGFDLTVRDTDSGLFRVYSNADGHTADPVIDFSAFACE